MIHICPNNLCHCLELQAFKPSKTKAMFWMEAEDPTYCLSFSLMLAYK